jgi:hypothetical protein
MADAAQRERLGRRARATYETLFTREHLRDRYQSVLDTATRKRIGVVNASVPA